MWALVERTVEPRSDRDRETLRAALASMVAEDPSFTASVDERSGRTVLGGASELHLDSKVDILKRTYSVDARIGAPQVAYRESLGRSADIDHTYKKQTGGTGQFARIKVLFEPGEPGSGFVFKSKVVCGAVPGAFIPGVERGLTSAKENGLLAGFPLIDFKATLYDGAYHDTDSSALAFEIAARAAFKELGEKGSPQLLEPIMKVEVLVPDEYLGGVIGDLKSRHGEIHGADQRGDAQVITAGVPLARMFGYGDVLHALSEGRARFAMQYDRYAPVAGSPHFTPDDFPPAMALRA